MKKEQGITLISLVIYIIGMIALMAITGAALSFYNNNVVTMNDTSDVNMELSKLETQMITETQTAGNHLISVDATTITFSSGNTYSYADNRIYQGTIPVSNYVKQFLASMETDGDKQILRMYVMIGKGKAEVVKNLSYVVERQATTAVGEPNYVLEYDDTTDVYGNLYKISDTEYHLVFNTDGDIAQGYTEAQLEARGTNIKDGSSNVKNSDGIWVSNQPWGSYSTKIKKVKIEEKITPTSIKCYFIRLSEITEVEGLNNLDTNKVTDMAGVFEGCSKLTNVNVRDWNTTNVTDMTNMFNGCNSLTSIDVSKWNTKNVKIMRAIFANCNSLTNINVNNWDTKNVTDMYCLFYCCNNLTTLDLNGLDMDNIENIEGMFSGCSNLTGIQLSEWNVSNVMNMKNAFYNCSSLRDIDVKKWNTGSTIDMNNLFLNCSSLTSIDLSGWDTTNVTNMSGMFYKCSNLTKIYAGDKWSTDAVIINVSMFFECMSLKGAISYDANKTDATYANWTTGYLTYKAST